MIVAWVIGLFLSFLGIWLLKNSRSFDGWRYSPEKEKPVLKVWSFTLLLILSIIPILNIIAGSIMIVVFFAQHVVGNWEFIGKGNKFIQFLNKPIK